VRLTHQAQIRLHELDPRHARVAKRSTDDRYTGASRRHESTERAADTPCSADERSSLSGEIETGRIDAPPRQLFVALHVELHPRFSLDLATPASRLEGDPIRRLQRIGWQIKHSLVDKLEARGIIATSSVVIQ
jgi:hypothetical protein